MAAGNKQVVYMRGKLMWAKVLGKPVPNYNKDGFEWTFDLQLDAAGVKQAKQHKELKIKDKDGEKVISFKQKELRASGDPNQPIRITDSAGNAWPQDEKLGNGTVADVKFEIRDFGVGKYPGIYPRAIRILDHVPFASSEFAPLDDTDEYASKGTIKKSDVGMAGFEDREFTHTASDDMDDDIPM